MKKSLKTRTDVVFSDKPTPLASFIATAENSKEVIESGTLTIVEASPIVLEITPFPSDLNFFEAMLF